MRTENKVTFQPSGRTVFVLTGTRVFEAAARAGVLLQSPCGGTGTCGKCRVRFVQGACEPTAACRQALTPAQLHKGLRLACQAPICSDCVIVVPDESLFETGSRILTAASDSTLDGKPAVWKKYVELPEPTNTDAVADLERLERVTGKLQVQLDILQDLPGRLRESGFAGTVAVCGNRLLAFEPGNTAKHCYGVAIDLGTTTIAAVLLDLAERRELAVSTAMNPQISFGDDVISRISRVRDNRVIVGKMQQATVETLNTLITDLTRKAAVDAAHVYEITLAGNTTMQHLVCGISPAALGEVPFSPACSHALLLPACELGFAAHPNARLYVFPNIGGFVGGDTVAGILANSLHESSDTALFVDIGTNGEIVLAHKGRLMAASTAAGPAFEGARIAAGMRATTGAIEKVMLNSDDIVFNVIGNTLPAGLCGTALIDLSAVLLRLGVIEDTGRLLGAEQLGSSVPAAIRNRLHPDGDHVNFLLAGAAETRTGEPIYLLQRDIRELQLATGAIRAGITLLLRRVGLTCADLDRVLLAGGFGNFIRRSNAQRIGLLPPVPSEHIHYVGNAANMGAKAVLLAAAGRDIAERIAATTEHVDLAMDAEFTMEFGMAMLFPRT